MRQIEVQELILDFIVDCLKMMVGNDRITKGEGKVIPVQFQYRGKPSSSAGWACVNIAKLMASPYKGA